MHVDARGAWVAPGWPLRLRTGPVEVAVTVTQASLDDWLLADALPFRLRLREDRAPEATVLRHGGLSLDLRTRRADVDGRTVELSAREFALAEIFLLNPGQVLTREQLLDLVWGYDFDPGSNVVDVYVGYLRKKLGTGSIATVRGVGYRLNPGSG